MEADKSLVSAAWPLLVLKLRWRTGTSTATR